MSAPMTLTPDQLASLAEFLRAVTAATKEHGLIIAPLGRAALHVGDIPVGFEWDSASEEYVLSTQVGEPAPDTGRERSWRRLTPDLLREVAEVYRAGCAGGAPSRAVANHFNVPHRTAVRWVQEARKIGELGPSVGPTAGEVTQ